MPFSRSAHRPPFDDRPQPLRRLVCAAVALLLGCALATTGSPSAAAAADATRSALGAADPVQATASAAVPGNPGVPSDPEALFVEDFENTAPNPNVLVTDYVGADGTNYQGSSFWVNRPNCNGFIVDYGSTRNSEDCTAVSNAATVFTSLKGLPYAFGVHQGLAEPETNGAAASFTAATGTDNEIQFETVEPLELPATNRFVTFSTDAAAANCTTTSPLLRFYLVDGAGNEIPVSDSAIDVCADPRGETVTVDGSAIQVGTFAADSSLLIEGATAGIRLRNENGNGTGNDGAYDEIEVLDVTPQLDKEFAPTSTVVGGTSTLTFTITNTSELAAKEGWGFTDALPDGLSVAPTPNVDNQCTGATVTAAAGGSSIDVSGGSLAAEEVSCTISVDVTSRTAGSYTNGAAQTTELTGLNAPGDATVEFASPGAACPSDAVLFQGSPTAPYSLDLVTGDVTAGDPLQYNINAVGYSPLDGGFYGIISPNDRVAYVSGDYATQIDLGSPDYSNVDFTYESLFDSQNISVGDVSPEGVLYVAGTATSREWMAIDVDMSSPTFLQVLDGGTMSIPVNLANNGVDWTYNPDDGRLYAVGYSGGNVQVIAHDPATGTATTTDLGQLTTPDGRSAGGSPYGATYGDADGFMYAVNNAPGDIWRIDMNNPSDATYFGTSQASTGNNDGARCINAQVPIDFGDAPDSYGTLLDSDGPHHGLAGFDAAADAAPLMLGSSVDVDTDGAPGPDADGDDTTGAADEDGVADPIGVLPGTETTVPVTVTNDSDGAATLAGWIDLDGNGTFDDGERITASLPESSGTASYDLVFPGGTVTGATYARFRLFAGDVAEPAPTGSATGGEVEDYVVEAQSRLAIQKSATPSGPVTPGDTVTYGVTVSNTGGLPYPDDAPAEITDDLSGALDDATLDPDSLTATSDGANTPDAPTVDGTGLSWSGALDPGETVTLSYTVTVDDPPGGDATLTNAVTGPPESNCLDGTEDGCTVAVPVSVLDLTKTAEPSDLVVGETITYTFVATNAGSAPLDEVAIAEASFTGSGSMSPLDCTPAQPSTLAPDESLTCTAIYTPTQADVDAGALDNSAEATATDSASNELSAIDSVQVPATLEPAYTLDKQAAVTDVDEDGATGEGDEIAYSFVIENTGNVTLAGIGVEDDLLTDAGIAVTCDPSTLAPGDSVICTADAPYVIDQADVDAGEVTNTATGVATPPDGVDPPEAPTDSTTTPVDQVAEIDLVKTASGGPVQAGDTVTYTFTATNTGTVSLSDVSIADTAFSGSGDPLTLTCDPEQPTTLSPGGELTCTATYVATQADVDAGSISNTAEASGTPPTGDPVTDTDAAQVAADQVASYTLDKQAEVTDVDEDGSTGVGDEINYSFVVENIGSVTLTDVGVDDPLIGVVTCDPTTLAPGDSVTCAAEEPYVIRQADVNAGGVANQGTGQVTPPDGVDPPTARSDDTFTPTDSVAAYTLDKQAQVNDVDGDGSTGLGDTISYSFTIENTGTVTLTAVGVADDLLAENEVGVTCDPTTLPPGESVTCTADAAYAITQADVNDGEVTNTATGQATAPDGTDPPAEQTDTTTTAIDQAPALDLVKTSDGFDLVVEDTVTYTFVTTNTGNVTLSDVSIADTEFSGSGELSALDCTPAQPTTLAPGESVTCTATYQVTQTDVDSGELSNTAEATGTDPNGEAVTDTDQTQVPGNQEAGYTLAKDAQLDDTDGDGLADAGEEIAYSFAVTNTGNVTLTDVGVADPMLTGAGLTVSCDPTTVAPGESSTCTTDTPYVVTQADVDAGAVANTATGQATPPDGVDPPEEQSDSTTTPADQVAAYSLDKQAEVTDVDEDGATGVGDEIAYAFVVENTGSVTLTEVGVTDDLLSTAGIGVTCDPGTLAPGESVTCTADSAYVVTQADVDAGEVTNTATGEATPPEGVDPPEEQTDSTTTPTDQSAAYSLDKQAEVIDVDEDGATGVGDTITYSFVVENTGTVTLTGVGVDDPMLADAGITVTCEPGTLAPGESVMCTADSTYVISQADVDAGEVTNTATGEATPPEGVDPPEEQTDSSTTPIEQTAAYTLDKQAEVTDVDEDGATGVGDTITYSFVVENTGTVTLTGVGVDDPMLADAGITVTCEPGTLAPGESVMCTADSAYVVTQADVDAGEVTNTATGEATPPEGVDPPEEQTDSSTTPIEQTAAYTLDKQAEVIDVDGDGSAGVGDTITYSFVVENTGTVTLTDVGVDDDLLTDEGIAVTCDPATLAPGESVTCTADSAYVISQADVDAGEVTNTATGQVTPPEGVDPPTGQTDSTTTPIVQVAGLALDKSADTEQAAVGQTVTYTFTATNTGNVTLGGVSIADTEFSGSGELSALDCAPAQPTPLGPDESVTCTATYQVTQIDVDSGALSNTAEATGADPDGEPVSDTDQVVISSDRQPAYTLDKQASLDDTDSDGLADVDEEIGYSFVVENTGNVTLTGVGVDDPMLAVEGITVTCDPTTLAPGESVTCDADAPYVVTQADVDAGAVTNTATGAATPPDGVDPPDAPTDSTSTETDQVASYTLDKQAEVTDVDGDGATGLGDTITYSFVIKNTGTVTLSGVGVDDPLVGVTCDPATLAPGDSVTCTADAAYVITQADVNAGEVVNTATGAATPPEGVDPPEEQTDSTTTPIEQASELELSKVSDTTQLVAGETVTYTFIATNTGNVTLSDVSIADTEFSGSGDLSALECEPAQPTDLGPEETLTCTATYQVTQVDVDSGELSNTAEATGTNPDGDPVTATDQTQLPSDRQASYTLVKEADLDDADDDGLADVGETIDYSFTVTNTGNVTLTEVGVDDPMLADSGIAVTCDPATLAPGESVVCTTDASYEVTQADVDAGVVANTATGQATLPDGVDPPEAPTDDTTTATDSTVGLDLEKTADASVVSAGDTFGYTFIATNTGTVTLHDVTISERRFSGSGDLSALECDPSQPTDLAPGAELVCTADYTVTDADAAAGTITNTARASGDAPLASTVTDTDRDQVRVRSGPPGPGPDGEDQDGPLLPFLPDTGARTGMALAIAVGAALLLAGLGLLITARRRRRAGPMSGPDA